MKPLWLRIGWTLFAVTSLAAVASRATGHPVATWTMLLAALATLGIAALAPSQRRTRKGERGT